VRIVLDTNVVLSGLLWGGTPYRLLEAIRQHPGIRLYTSPPLLEELAEVLMRPSPTKRMALIGKTAQSVMADYIQIVEYVEPIDTPAVVTRDPDDDHVLAAAVAAQADAIVSGDDDLLSLGAHQGIPILTAAKALAQISADG
jgi:putative PIN family toxin of toxin-antitoxin system